MGLPPMQRIHIEHFSQHRRSGILLIRCICVIRWPLFVHDDVCRCILRTERMIFTQNWGDIVLYWALPTHLKKKKWHSTRPLTRYKNLGRRNKSKKKKNLLCISLTCLKKILFHFHLCNYSKGFKQPLPSLMTLQDMPFFIRAQACGLDESA